jgi:hypothetical protein
MGEFRRCRRIRPRGACPPRGRSGAVGARVGCRNSPGEGPPDGAGHAGPGATCLQTPRRAPPGTFASMRSPPGTPNVNWAATSVRPDTLGGRGNPRNLLDGHKLLSADEPRRLRRLAENRSGCRPLARPSGVDACAEQGSGKGAVAQPGSSSVAFCSSWAARFCLPMALYTLARLR